MHRRITTTLATLSLSVLLLLVAVTASAQSDEEFLRPDEAFKFSAVADGSDAVIAEWDVTSGYYLYKSKFKFRSETDGITLGEADIPTGKMKKDENFGDVEILRDKIQVRIPLSRSAGTPDKLELNVKYQGCADAGLCYPPQRKKITIELPKAAAPESAVSALSNFGESLAFDDDEEVEILPVAEAFRFSAEVAGPDQLRLLWQIADGTYLYQDKIKIAVSGDGVSTGDYQLPEAEIKKNALRPDGTTGDLAVYHNQIDLLVPLKRNPGDATEITLKTVYQGCAEAGVCYPPQRPEQKLTLPPMSASAATTAPDTPSATQAAAALVNPQPATEGEDLSELDQISNTLAGGNTWLVIITFFGFGLLLSLTPCIFPMIPILSGIIAGHGTSITTRKAFVLSLVYVLAMALTYTAAGVLAGLFGGNLQAAFQNPWILSTFSVVFVLLALSMFGFYELQLPSSWQSKLSETSNRQKGGSLTGVAVMGLLSALIVGPCVAPPLAGALIFIGQTGDAVLGGLALFALSMGMGIPLIVIGTSAGKLLPRAGAWMDTVKSVFGVGMLAVAIIMLERIVPPAVAMLLWGSLLIVSAIYMGAMKQLAVEASGWARLWKGLGMVLLVYGSLMLIGAAAGGKDTVQPLRGIGGFAGGGSAEAAHIQFKPIKSVADLEREVAAASAAGKPVMLDFYADWCVSCKEMERYTFSDPAVITALSDFILLQADVTANDDIDQALIHGHFGLPGPPSIMFYGRDGEERKNRRVVGFMAADDFADHVRNSVK